MITGSKSSTYRAEETIRHSTPVRYEPGYVLAGDITDRYIAYQAEKAKGGVGLTQFGGATAVSAENSFYYGQINGSMDKVLPQFRKMAAAIHQHGAACTVQLTHGADTNAGT